MAMILGENYWITLKCYNGYSHYSGSMTSTTTIQVTTQIRDLLKSFGSKGDTYNDIIERLVDRANYVQFMRENYEILDKERNWVSLDELE